jgi:hypothetical protein
MGWRLNSELVRRQEVKDWNPKEATLGGGI